MRQLPSEEPVPPYSEYDDSHHPPSSSSRHPFSHANVYDFEHASLSGPRLHSQSSVFPSHASTLTASKTVPVGDFGRSGRPSDHSLPLPGLAGRPSQPISSCIGPSATRKSDHVLRLLSQQDAVAYPGIGQEQRFARALLSNDYEQAFRVQKCCVSATCTRRVTAAGDEIFDYVVKVDGNQFCCDSDRSRSEAWTRAIREAMRLIYAHRFGAS
ncbi:hypothetical protein EXIGLDRAFT_726582 [Exidia glandulosa HHB12029]|uniref:Uncharacterized protein n=1 Tax=Exidia glandulosa HHB12029 TaxID=1314781 RepID=A0A165DNT8_EXIGL|nr:hypothetical protein EXIGLDRAFT_726582 [Exidia glandulosa HHB12029]